MKKNNIPFILILILFIFLIGLGINNYFIPRFYDNLTYFSLAQSLSHGDGYQAMGKFIIDWPPAFPIVISGFFFFFGDSVVVAKLVVAIFSIAGLTIVYALMKQENRPYPLLTILIMALLPTSITMATRIASEWMFITLTFAFLLVLEKLKDQVQNTEKLTLSKNLILGSLCGILLGIASLTRYIGVLLGVALLAQCWMIYRNVDRSKINMKLAPFALAAVAGASIFLFWICIIFTRKYYNPMSFEVSTYEKIGFAIFSKFNITSISEYLTDLFFQSENIIDRYPSLNTPILVSSYLILIIMIIGFIKHIRSKNVKASDFYVLTTFLLLAIYEWKTSRYYLTLFPFLFSYIIIGISAIFNRIYSEKIKKIGKIIALSILTLWISILFSMDLFLIFKGNKTDMNGLSPLISHTATDFYTGTWKKMYDITQKIPKLNYGEHKAIGVDKDIWTFRYFIHVLTGYQVFDRTLTYDKSFDYVIRSENGEFVLDQINLDNDHNKNIRPKVTESSLTF